MKKRRPRGSTAFSFEKTWGKRDRLLLLAGSISPYEPQRGPTYDCGGTPEVPACIEDLAIVLIHKRKDGTLRKRDVPDKSGKLAEALEETIWDHHRGDGDGDE